MTTILAIDDEKDTLADIMALLCDAFPDARIITALSGEEGIEKAGVENPDVILLDLVMPGMDGYETCEILKSNVVLQRIPVVILTGAKADVACRILALKLGAEAFLTKPVDAAELSAQVSAMLRIKRSEDKIRKENERLEELVQERTKDLEKSTSDALRLMEDLKVEIEERKRMDLAIGESEAKYRALFENAVEGIFQSTPEGRPISANPAMVKLFGYDSLQEFMEQVTDIARQRYTNPEDRETYKKVLETEGIVKGFEVQLIDKKGKPVWASISARVIKDDKGAVLCHEGTIENITERKLTEGVLKKREAELEIKSINLEEMNAALKVLLKEREHDKTELEEKILSNVKELVLPYIEKLKKSRLDSQYMTYVDIIEKNLNDIVSPFLQKMGLKYAKLTPTEIEIANLIKNGKSTKEIGALLHMSSAAINFHRNNIRKKLGLNNEKINLRSFLMSLQ